MGLFQQRPEEPSEWAGLPSEPWAPREPAERISSAPALDLPLFGAMPARETIVLSVDLGGQPTAPAALDGGDAE